MGLREAPPVSPECVSTVPVSRLNRNPSKPRNPAELAGLFLDTQTVSETTTESVRRSRPALSDSHFCPRRHPLCRQIAAVFPRSNQHLCECLRHAPDHRTLSVFLRTASAVLRIHHGDSGQMRKAGLD